MNQKLCKIITIDGPAGAGKSTLARELARRLAWVYLDTGALYRAVAWAVLARGLDPDLQAPVEELARALKVEIRPGPQGAAIVADGEEVTERLRTPAVSLAASQVSAWPGVREALFGLQRDLGGRGEIVAEGRDMGTVVFPEAGLKFFLSADPKARAKRRFDELKAKGEEATLDEVLADQLKRDEADRTRAVSPLAAAPDALSIDTTNLGVEDVLQVMIKAFRNRFLCG